MSCVTNTIVLPISRCSRRNSSCSECRTIGSTALNGSSISMIGGSAASFGSRPTRSSSSIATVRVFALSQPSSLGTVATLSNTVRCGNSPACCVTYPIPRRSATGSPSLMSLPSIEMTPSVRSIVRLIIRSEVVLPQPEGPTNTVILLLGAWSERPLTATVPSGYRFVTSLNSIIRRPFAFACSVSIVERLIDNARRGTRSWTAERARRRGPAPVGCHDELQGARSRCGDEQSGVRILDVLQTLAIGQVRVRAALADRLVGSHGEDLRPALVQPVVQL